MAQCLDSGANPNAFVGVINPGSILCYAIEGIRDSFPNSDRDYLAVIRLLVKRWAKVDLSGEGGRTPLMKAASTPPSQDPEIRTEQLAAVRLLLELGANIHARDEHKSTPLHYASIRCWPEMIALLLESGADPHARDDNNDTPADVAKTMSLSISTDDRKAASLKAASLKLQRGAKSTGSGKANRVRLDEPRKAGR